MFKTGQTLLFLD